MPPLSSEPGYRLHDEDYRLAIRHRLGQLPFDDLRDELCIGCARRYRCARVGVRGMLAA